MPTRIHLRLLVLITFILTPSILSADIVHLKNGGKIEGIVRVRGDRYVVTTDKNIEVEIPIKDVLSVEVTKTHRDVYREKRARIGEGDLKGLLELAKWCEEAGLESEARATYESIIRLDPDHEAARRALGFVRVGDAWLTGEEARPHLGLVKHRGRWVTPEEKANLEAEEKREKERRRIRKLVRRVGSRIPESSEEARARLMAYDDEDKFPVLLDALENPEKPVRIYAAKELGRIGKEEAVRPLAKTAIEDRFRTVRITATRALNGIGAKDTAVPFIENLNSANPYHRLHAVEGLSMFPDRRSVHWLIKTWRGISGGFGQGYTMIATLQTYISDYQLSSGGTGFIAMELADPELGTLTTGVVFEAKIQYVELAARTQTLVYLTGQELGSDRKAWARWWNVNKDTFELAARDPFEEARAESDPESEG